MSWQRDLLEGCGFCFLFLFAMIGILIFYALFGCPFEMIKCYLYGLEEDNNRDAESLVEREKPRDWKWWTIVCSLAVVGMCLQPVYVMMYLAFAFLWFVKEMGWWIFLL